jgi:hypothetical protein
MALFSRRGKRAPSPDGQQIPDRLGEQAALSYGIADFAAAFEQYAEAVDKIHTMCVLANRSSRIRVPGEQDQPILDGLVNSLGAALTSGATFNPHESVERSVAYLLQIADAAGGEAARYRNAAQELESTLKRG